MEGLHARKKNKTNPEDELEYMDEVGKKKRFQILVDYKERKKLNIIEQETLLQDLRNQNDAANSNILVRK